VVGFALALMLRVLFKLLLHPELLAMHIQGYGDLLREESGQLVRQVRNRLLLCAVGACSLLLGVMWAGVALLLWSALPSLDPHHAWLLWAFPLSWIAVALACALACRLRGPSLLFPRTREQIQLDVLALRQASKA
jgi:hypothetical protein